MIKKIRLTKMYILKVKNFLNFRDFLGIFLNFSEFSRFILDLFKFET